MKRSPLNRGTSQLKRSPLNRVSKKQQARQRERSETKIVGEVCQVGRTLALLGWGGCTHWATERHHVQKASAVGPDTAENLLPSCRACNSVIETQPALARAASEIARRRGLPPVVIRPGDPEWVVGKRNGIS